MTGCCASSLFTLQGQTRSKAADPPQDRVDLGRAEAPGVAALRSAHGREQGTASRAREAKRSG